MDRREEEREEKKEGSNGTVEAEMVEVRQILQRKEGRRKGRREEGREGRLTPDNRKRRIKKETGRS